MPDSQTLKDRATQLLRGWSGALITQLWLRGQSSLLASIWIWIQECRCPWEWLEVWWVAVKENHLSESFNPSTQSTELPSWTNRTIKKETCSVFMIFERKLSLFFLTDKKTIFWSDCNSSFTLAVNFYKWLCRPLLIKSEEGRIWSFKKSEIWKSDFKIPILWIYFPFTVARLIRTNTFRD